jgi:hypothetical protein
MLALKKQLEFIADHQDRARNRKVKTISNIVMP